MCWPLSVFGVDEQLLSIKIKSQMGKVKKGNLSSIADSVERTMSCQISIYSVYLASSEDPFNSRPYKFKMRSSSMT
jgi:hypothetical protein